MPTATDLVTDLPADFEVFGQAVATSMADLLGGTTGQVLSKTTNADMDFTWVAANPGDITAVTAGTGISGGGTSGAVTITNSMATEITAKGDLIVGTGSATFDNLAAGSDGSSIVADSSTSTGLRYQSNFSAGKNAIINGDMGIWQRGTSISLTNNTAAFGPDRFNVYTSFSAGTSSFSQQTFTPGTAPVAGYEGTYFARLTCGSTATYFELNQGIEDVRKFAGQTVTFSFWAKASASIVITPGFNQRFGSGGSSTVTTSGSNQTLTTSWTRYSVTINLPSISGKTLAAGNHLNTFLVYASGTINSATIDIWGWQVEASNTATAFQTATGTIQGELAACQRYYESINTNAGRVMLNGGYVQQGGVARFTAPVVQKRTTPTVTITGTLNVIYGTGSEATLSSISELDSNTAGNLLTFRYNTSGTPLTSGQACGLYASNNTTFGISAEL